MTIPRRDLPGSTPTTDLRGGNRPGSKTENDLFIESENRRRRSIPTQESCLNRGNKTNIDPRVEQRQDHESVMQQLRD